MRWFILLVTLLVLVNSASAVIKDNASILLINDNDAKFMRISYDGLNYNSDLLLNSKFYDWKKLTLADIDGDGYNELIAVRDIGPDFYIYDYIDNELVQKTDAKSISSFSKDLDWVKPVPMNIDGDKDDELIIVNNKYGRFYSIDRNGAEFDINQVGETMVKDWTAMASADIDQDGSLEIIMLRKDTKPVYIFEYYNGELSALENTKRLGDTIGDINIDAMAVGDLDGDKIPEIILASSEQKKIYSLSFSNKVAILSQMPYTKVTDMDIADVDNDGKNELVLLTSERNPVVVYKYFGGSLSEKVVQSLTGDIGWIGLSAGKFTNEIAEAPKAEENKEIPVAETPVPVQEIPVSGIPASNPEVNETITEKAPTNYLNYILFIIILVCLGVIAYFIIKFIPKSEEKEEKPSNKKENVYVGVEERESMWPTSKRKKDLQDIKELIKNKKNK